MSDYEPGTVAEATVRGVKGVRVFRRYSPDTGIRDWAYNPDPVRGLNYSCDSDAGNVVTDIRPLVVLDPEDYSQIRGLIQGSSYLGPGAMTRPLTEAIQQVLRKMAETRIPEPGLWGVVEAGAAREGSPLRGRRTWVRHSRGWVDTTALTYDWDSLIDPVLIREGLS
jgi:hypothetical protein